MKLCNFLFLAAARVSLAQNTPIQVEMMPADVIQERLASAPYKLAERRERLEALFEEQGCTGDKLRTLKVPHSAEPNVLCTLSGEDSSAGTIVIGGHYDLVSLGRGVVDDWSGAVLLPSLYRSLKQSPRKHTYVFIAFAGEETGLNGSTEYLHRLSKEDRARIRAMINLECLGMTPPKVWASRADKRLLNMYGAVVQALGVQAAASNVDQIGDDDSHPFLEARIPVLTIHSITQENFRILHSTRDQVKAIHTDDYYAAYRVAATFLAFLDTNL